MSTATVDKYTVPGLQRGLELLGQFTRKTPILSGADLARKLDLPRASVFRLLHTLEHCGLVERVSDSSSYKLSIGILRLGFEYLSSMELAEHARPVIDQLRDATGYSAHLVVRDGRDVVFIVKAAGRSALFHSIQVGARLPAYATVLGRLLLSDLDKAALTALYPDTPLPRYTDKTPTTIKPLQALIAADRAKGYSQSESGFETGISVIAAPVFNDDGKVVAAVSITVPVQQLSLQQSTLLIPQVQQTAAQLTQRISHSLKSTAS
jgi:DNA-binding IclR family transcriptional regulator